MKRKLLVVIVPLLVATPLVLGSHRARPPHSAGTASLQAFNHAEMEKSVGFHLLAPSALPRGMQPGTNGVRQGAVRILCDYTNGDDTLIVAQEKRNAERDAYNQARFVGHAVDINGTPGTISRGSLGERRLTYSTPETTLVLSSSSLSSEELANVARSMK